jgi:nitrous oxidase accessory protein
MKYFIKLFLFVGILIIFGREVTAAETEVPIQSKINATPEGGTLTLKAGTYEETLVLKKPITITGEEGMIINACTDKPAVTIAGKNVTLKGIKIIGCIHKHKPPAISISGNNHHLENLSIESPNIAIKLENTTKSSFKNIEIYGQGKENGIDLWKSHQNAFENILITRVQDGFYLEDSHQNTLLANHIQESRYGLHVMFSDQIAIVRNTSTRNVTGAMLMGTNKSTIEGNKFYENNKSVNAKGMMLYDVHDSAIRRNELANNRVGMFIDDSSGNEITGNELISNFVAAQMTNISQNKLEDNTFLANVNHIQAFGGGTDSDTNQIRHNYWDSALTLDTDGDGKSNLPYQADPYFLTLIRETPEYQLFFQHPGLILLQKMLKSPEGMIVTDVEPQMTQSNSKQPQSQPSSTTWALSLIMILTSLFIIFYGRKQI